MKTFYIRKRKDVNIGQQVITVVYELNKETRMIKLAWAVCSKHDEFVKEVGRHLAISRFDRIGRESVKYIDNPVLKLSNLFKYSGEYRILGSLDNVSVHQYIEKFINGEMIQEKLKLNTDLSATEKE